MQQESTQYQPIDNAFAKLIKRMDGNQTEGLAKYAADCSLASRQGSSCIALPQGCSLRNSSVVGTPENTHAPLIEFNHHLYLQRHFVYEDFLHHFIYQTDHSVPLSFDAYLLQTHFPTQNAQQHAAENTFRSRFSAISGAPGTGKTTTLIGIILMLRVQGLKRIALCAPTGKAASRLNDALLEHSINDLNAQTIERLLRLHPDRTHVTYDADNPLPIDVLIVDEAAMVDNARFYHLIQALPKSARLIIAGDHNQLPAIESGQLMQALFEGENPPPFCTVLDENYRFDPKSVLGQLARHIATQDTTALKALIVDQPQLSLDIGAGLEHAQSAYRTYHQTIETLNLQTDAVKAMNTLKEFQLLTAMRHGKTGSLALNRHFIDALKPHVHHNHTQLHGMPIIITQNAPELSLFNGDIGIVDLQPSPPEAVFVQNEKTTRFALPNLPPFEPAYALTVHKAQGSEYESVLCMLEGAHENLITRALLYTAVTRARKNIALVASLPTVQYAIAHQTKRLGNLTVKRP